jgi:hypothetical protein
LSSVEKVEGINPEKKNGEWTGRWIIDTVVRSQRFTATSLRAT